MLTVHFYFKYITVILILIFINTETSFEDDIIELW